MTLALDENPLTAGLERLPVPPTTLVIFGATGDLARRKLLPALYNLAHDGALPERFHLVGVALLEQVKYVSGRFDEESVYERLAQVLDSFDERAGEPLNRAFYLSTAPDFFATIVGHLGDCGLSRRAEAEVRVIIEKP